jgi:hypothetical protein
MRQVLDEQSYIGPAGPGLKFKVSHIAACAPIGVKLSGTFSHRRLLDFERGIA